MHTILKQSSKRVLGVRIGGHFEVLNLCVNSSISPKSTLGNNISMSFKDIKPHFTFKSIFLISII